MTERRRATTTQPPAATVKRPPAAPLSHPEVDLSTYNSMFVGMTLTMSWQLAIVVIIPIVGGHLLDQRFGTEPVLTLLGVFLAFVGVIGVLVRIVRLANNRVADLDTKAGKK